MYISYMCSPLVFYLYSLVLVDFTGFWIHSVHKKNDHCSENPISLTGPQYLIHLPQKNKKHVMSSGP